MRTAGLLGALFLIGLILMIAGFEGRIGALLAAVFTPSALIVNSQPTNSGQ